MKNFKLLSVVTLVALVVVFSSCTATRSGSDYYETDARSGMYSNSRYGNERIIIVERDPFTGRYYEVNRYGGGIFSSPYDSRYYNDSRYYRNNNYGRNGHTRNNNAPVRQDNRQTDQQKEEARKKASDARDQIFGTKKN